MIETLYGRIFEINVTRCTVIIECAGVGYHVTVTANTLSHLPSPKFSPDGSSCAGEMVRIFTHMAVREDAVELYGFFSREELAIFKLLISVSGIGPKAAMSILSRFTPRGLAQAVLNDDGEGIAKAPGVGPKTAARLTIDLKDKIKKSFPEYMTAESGEDIAEIQMPIDGSKLADARDALLVLGYSRSEIAAAMKNADLSESVEDIIKKALSVLIKS